jgi:hypothetical protein
MASIESFGRLWMLRQQSWQRQPQAFPSFHRWRGLVMAFPAFSFGAAGRYQAMLLTCIDPRFPEPSTTWKDVTWPASTVSSPLPALPSALLAAAFKE